MPSIIDYVQNARETFADKPLNRVDSLVFSWVAYMRIPEEIPDACTGTGATLASIGSRQEVLGLVAPLHDPKSSEQLLRALATSPRFADVLACHAADEWSRKAEKQFSAVTLVLPGHAGAYIAFRGTDDTLVGWKENFNMAFQSTVPAQIEATAYLEAMAAALEGPLWIGGHSKGGNLAAFAANTCTPSVRERVQRCFAHDAPGFTANTTQASTWAHADDLVDRTVPEESIIGLLFDGSSAQVNVVKSTSPGLLQHSPFSWVVEGDDFATARAVSYDTYRTNKRLGAWIAGMTLEERERFVDVLYKIVQSSGEVTLTGLTSTLADGSLDIMLQRLDGLPQSERSFFMGALEDLVATLLLGPAPANPQTSAERADAAADKMDDATARFNDHASKLDKYLGL